MPYGLNVPRRTVRPEDDWEQPEAEAYFGDYDWRPNIPPPEEWLPEPQPKGGSPYRPHVPEKNDEGLSTGAKVAIGVLALGGAVGLWYVLK